MLKFQVKYLKTEQELNNFLAQFDPQNKEKFPILCKMNYIAVDQNIIAVVEYIEGELEKAK